MQVKTTTTREGGAWKVYLSRSRAARRVVYRRSEIDWFFLIDGELDCYLVPIEAVEGLHAVHLDRLREYQVDKLWLRAVSTTGVLQR